VETGEQSVWAKIEVPVDHESLVLKQVMYPSKDGTMVPLFILHKKGLVLDGTHPTLLTGYGGFNMSMTPFYSGMTALWAEKGGVFCVANLRGGGEFGEAWHKAGMLRNKQNVFDDFIAAGEWLIREGYTSPDHLGILGGSNGGLLVGACLVQRPDLYGAVICTYPLLDMVRFHKFMVAPLWMAEYGCSDDPEQFEYLLAYSPYHNVEEGVAYPSTLFITGDGDTRVAPLHARKMAAMVQAKNGGEHPIMLRYHIKAGHAGSMPTDHQIQQTVEILSFLKWRLGWM
jgi:prolyl oligopeptidase